MTDLERKLARMVVAACVMRELQKYLRRCHEKVGPERSRRYDAAREAELEFDRLSCGVMEEFEQRGLLASLDDDESGQPARH